MTSCHIHIYRSTNIPTHWHMQSNIPIPQRKAYKITNLELDLKHDLQVLYMLLQYIPSSWLLILHYFHSELADVADYKYFHVLLSNVTPELISVFHWNNLNIVANICSNVILQERASNTLCIKEEITKNTRIDHLYSTMAIYLITKSICWHFSFLENFVAVTDTDIFCLYDYYILE